MKEKCQVIIPMSGLGERFIRAGYEKPKPLIEVDGRPIISWVLKLFPNAQKVTFICRDQHLKETNMKEILQEAAPFAEIVSIPGHKKGPVYAVHKAQQYIYDDLPALVSYCDYYMHWNFSDFLKEVIKRDADGAIPSYSGFHPHLIPKKNLYATCKVDEDNSLIEIREKYSWTKNKEDNLTSPGVYYFRSGAILKKYFSSFLQDGEALGGEYYASLIYNQMVKDGLKVWVPSNISHFCQWGTPEDLKNYQYWTQIVRGF